MNGRAYYYIVDISSYGQGEIVAEGLSWKKALKLHKCGAWGPERKLIIRPEGA